MENAAREEWLRDVRRLNVTPEQEKVFWRVEGSFQRRMVDGKGEEEDQEDAVKISEDAVATEDTAV